MFMSLYNFVSKLLSESYHLEDLNGKLFCKMICSMSHVQHYILFEFYNKFSYLNLFNKSVGKVQKSKLIDKETFDDKKFKISKISILSFYK